jgi:actin-like ATPase involved in cell morphogenesis
VGRKARRPPLPRPAARRLERRGLDHLLAEETGLKVQLSDNCETAIVMGTGMALDSIEILKQVVIY